MKKITLRERVNDISPYLQINKAFRHVHGMPAAAVLATLLHKYAYWEKEGLLKTFKAPTGVYLQYFFISKLDISLDSGVALSTLEKKDKSNPIILLANLKMIKILTHKKTNKSNRFILYSTIIIKKIVEASKLFDEDMEMLKLLSRQYRRGFYKALNGKLTREQVYAKYREYLDYDELEIDNYTSTSEISAPIEEVPAQIEDTSSPNEEIPCLNEGRTKNTISKNLKEKKKETNSPLMNSGSEMEVEEVDNREEEFNEIIKNSEMTRSILENGINAYALGEIKESMMHNLLKNYLPDNIGSTWKMSKEDAEYIKKNLLVMEPGYMFETIEYINNNVHRMLNGEREMRFGSMLAGILEKVFYAGIGYNREELPTLNKKEYKNMLVEMPEKEEFDFIDKL